MRRFLLFLSLALCFSLPALAYTSLSQDITRNGVSQRDLVTFLENVRDLVNQLQHQASYESLGNPGFVISTNFDVKNGNAISYLNGGTNKTLSANTNFDTGTAKVLTASKWGAALLTVNSSGSAVLTWTTLGNYASEALAIAALPTPAATDTVVGYVTVLSSASGWTAGTDALQSGTGGNAATTTTYYNSNNPNNLVVDSNALSLSPP